MNTQPRIQILKDKKMIGIHKTMSIANNLTFQLWSEFGPKVKTIRNIKNTSKFSLQEYDAAYFDVFDPMKNFVKWALVEVDNFEDIPNTLSSYSLPGGLYAVFDFKGSSNIIEFFQYIFNEWLPKSEYKLDDRPHFEVLGEKYKKDDPKSEEEIWIPIRKTQH